MNNKSNTTKECPLTNSQLGIYLDCIDQSKDLNYLIPLTFYFSKEKIDSGKLSKAFYDVVKTYSAFSTVIKIVNGNPIMSLFDGDLPIIPVINIDDKDVEKYKSELFRPFTFDGKLLWRGAILETQSKIILTITIHHTIFDGTSIAVFNNALSKAYNNEELSEEGTLFDFKENETNILKSQLSKEAEAYFENYFDGYENDSNVIPNKASTGKFVPNTLEYPVVFTEDKIKSFAKENGVTENIVFLSAFSYALSKFNNQKEAVFTSVESGRFGGGFDNSIGMFVKSFPLRFLIDENTTSTDFIKYVKSNYFDTLKHNHIEFAKLVKEYAGCADVEFIYQGEILKGAPVGGVTPYVNVLDTYEPISNFDVLMFKTDGAYKIWLGYNSDLYTESIINCFADLYITVLGEILKNKKLCEFDLVSQKSNDFIDKSNDTYVKTDTTLTISDIFEDVAVKHKNNIAVSYKNKKIDYSKLQELTHKLAFYINQKGIGAEEYVPILINRNEFMPICAFGVILSGAAYQPLDPSYPEERLNFMVSDSNAKLLIADRDLINLLSDYKGDILFTDEIENLPLFDYALPKTSTNDAALLIYTSGTTGTPKGCILENKNIIALHTNHKKNVELSEKSKVATVASFGFDAAAMDIFSTILSGGELCIIPEEIKLDIPQVEKFYTENEITNGFMTTQLGRMFLEQTKCKTLKHFVLGGEKLVPFTPPSFVVCHNDYGPSETIAYICGYVIKDNSVIQPIGTPSDNIKLYIVDDRNRMLPPGASGELCISGSQVGRGYLNRPEKTQEVFIKNPFCNEKEYARLYKTGDVVRMLPDGNYDFIGRRDGQVKIRGFRVELTEIEQIIREYDGITNATVQAYDDATSGKYIAAYIVADKTIDIKSLNDYILKQKPPYMVPAVTMQIDKIPVNANGKVDKKKLPEPQRQYEEVVLPENQTQQKVFDIVKDIVGNDLFGIDTDLYFAGLSSIGSIKLCTDIAECFSLSIQIKDIRQNNTVRKLGALIDSSNNTVLTSHKILPDYPLTKTQEGIMVESLSKPDSTFYNIPLLLKLSDDLDIAKLKSAIVTTVLNHPYLETELFTDQNGVIRQKRNESKFCEDCIEIISVDSIDDIKETSVTPFVLMNSPLFRCRIYTEKCNYLFLEFHHIIADGTSINILISEIEKTYFGKESSSEKYDSFDLSLDEFGNRNSSLLFEAKNHYQNLLDGLDMNFLPGSDILPNTKRDTGLFTMDEVFANATIAKEFSSNNNISLNGLLCSAFGFVIAKYAGTDYCVFNTVYNGRNDSRTASTIGMLVKTLPVVCNIGKENSLDISKEITEQLLDSMSNDLYSFAEICKDFGVKNDIVFVFQGDSFNFDSFCGEKSEKIDLTLSESKMPISVQVVIQNNKFKYIVEYDKELYTEYLIKTIISAFDKVISSFVLKEDVKDITLLTPEISEKLDIVNNTEFAYDTSKTITDYYIKEVNSHPNKELVVYKNKTYTYNESFDISCRIAEYLIKNGVKSGDIVSILIPRDETMILSAHGTIMSGAAYLGIDPTYPKERINFMLKDSNTKLLIAHRSLYYLLDEFDGKILYTDKFEKLPKASENFNPAKNVKPDSLALVVYSSGTTGVPKGAMLTHKNIVAFFQNYSLDMELNENANIAMYASFGFDGGAMDIFCTPMSGATLYIIPDDIRLDLEKLEQFYIQNKITSGFMTTQVGTMFIKNTHCKTLKHFQVGGEKLIPTLPPSWVTFYNGYGPSETMCYVNNFTVTNTDSLQPIGKPNRNIKEYIVDKFGNRLPFGACGELCISGAQTGIGYLNRAEKTAESFVKNPFCDENPYDRMYKTGDIVRQMPDGNYVFEGRRDGQVKIRGFRVELTEIEQIIREYSDIKNVAVIAFDSNAGGKSIAAYIVSDNTIDISKLNAFIASKKPDYMVPAVTIQITEIPLTANGKIDKRKLPEPITTSTKKGAEPANETEEIICNIFEDVLGLSKVYADDDFFQIGGSSISAIQAVVKCNNKGFDIVFKNLFTNPTPHSLYEYIEGRHEDETYASTGEDASNYDYSALKYNTLKYVDEITYQDIGDVLLTGSTGFLGSHILKELLDNTSSNVICLVRSKDDMDSSTRFNMMMTYYFEDWYTKEKSKRVTIIDGELGDVDVLEQIKKLHFDTIINSAANVKHFAAGDELIKDNFSGVENLINLAHNTNSLLVQISSTSVSGEAVEGKVSDDFLFRESDLNIGQSLENKYIYSKYQAEQAVIDAVSRGIIKAKIIRLGNLMARFDDSEFQVNAGSNAFLKQFIGYKRLGLFPVDLMDKKIEFSPIDATAKAVILLSGTPDKFTVFHAKNCNNIHYGYFINAMNKEGIDIKVVNNEIFTESIDNALKHEEDILDFSTLIAYKDNGNSDGKENVMHQIESDTTFTTKALYRLGFSWPLISSDYLEKMINTLISLGFFA